MKERSYLFRATTVKELCVLGAFLLVCVVPSGRQARAQAVSQAADRNAGTLYAVGQHGSWPALQRPVTIDLDRVSLVRALRAIAQEADVGLAYSTDLVPEDKLVSLQIERGSVAEALRAVLENTDLRVLITPNNEIVLMRAPTTLEALPAAPVMPARLMLPLKMLSEVMPGHGEGLRGAEPSRRQTGAVAGVVTDSTTGEPLPGVNVVIAGTQQGAATDAQGRFRIPGVEAGTHDLVASFVGYTTKQVEDVEVVDGETTQVDIALQPSTLALKNVVVTALGIERTKESLAYSTSTVEGEELARAPVTNFATAIAGKVEGINATAPATGPGGSSRIVIRGASSLDGNNQPLYVINGMPIDNTIVGTITSPGGQGFNIDHGDGIGDINLSDIESVTVLKGGAAAALYGSRASNGAILITLKDGVRREGVGVNVKSYTSFEQISVIPDYQYIYGQGQNGQRPQTQASAISSGRLSFGEKMDGEPYVQFDGVKRPYSPKENNIRNFYRLGISSINSIAFSGGSESVTYRLSGANTTSRAIIPNSSFRENNVSLNIDASLSDKLSVGAYIQYHYEKGNNKPKVGYADRSTAWGVYMVANTVDVRDLAPGYDENGNEIAWNPVPVATNPYFVVNKYETNDEKSRYIGMLNIRYDVSDNVFIRGRLSRDYSSLRFEGIEPMGNNFRPLGSYRLSMGVITENNGRLTLNYDAEFLRHFSFTGFAGMSARRSSYDRTLIEGSEFVTPDLYSYANLAIVSTSPTNLRSGTNSLFGSAVFGYEDMAFLTITGRQDWFSTLNPAYNSIFYPSIGGSFILSEAIQLPSIINTAKLRGSWAQVGGASVAPYAIYQTYSMLEGGHNGRPVQNISSNTLPNLNLRPLSATSYEVGLDMQMLNYRLGVDLTYYNSTTTDDIVQSNIASSSGYTAALLNVGKVNNRGIELRINGYPVQGAFNWNVTYNAAYNDSEILSLGEGLEAISVGGGIGGGTIRHVVGEPYGTLWGFRKKRNEDGQIIYDTNSGYAARSDLQLIGRGVHPLTMGITNTFNYKNWSLNVLVSGKFGAMIYSNTYQYGYRFGHWKTTLAGRENGLTLTGADQEGNNYTRTVPVEELDTYYDNDKHYSALFMFDNDYVKLGQVTVTYNLPTERIHFLGARAASISIVGNNLAILYKASNQNYFDPESNYNVGNAQGLEAFGVPGTRSIGITIQATF